MLDTVHAVATNILSESIIRHSLRRHMMSKIISAEVIPDLGFLFEVLQNNDDCPKCERTGNNSEAAFEVGGGGRRRKKKEENQRTMQMSIITFSPLSTRPILITP